MLMGIVGHHLVEFGVEVDWIQLVWVEFEQHQDLVNRAGMVLSDRSRWEVELRF